jgi:3-methylcrotonyl-CoA carboxylase alpha subunit
MHKILIANRGEIARRIIRTAHRMGYETVAVYSEADADAPHVREAGQAVLIGPAPAAESYLRVDTILDACRRSGADAVHPGYGFLSENAGFAEACEASDIVFIGPPPSAIKAMGLKDAAKALMKQAGVPVVPGYQGDDQALARLERAAKGIGYPLLIKAVAGGGGKGMRRVDKEAEFAEALIAAQREALRAFGNDGVLIEKYLTKPRHIEVQVFADAHGNVVHLFERDCSLQRRHQKVIEEAPAPGMPAAYRQAMGEAAVTAARAIGYRGAGTVEFIVDATEPLGSAPFYFMEMNTRLQVEHPVTEMITGLDLVEWQIRVANGERLPLRQDQLAIQGHSVEARFYAEDPENGFLPSTGRLTRMVLPTGLPGVRIDAGVEQGGEVTVHYDPMIAKVIAHGSDRQVAIDRLVAALDACVVEGVRTNRAFLARLVDHHAFRAGEVDTAFIERHGDELRPDDFVPDRVVALAALASVTTAETVAPASLFERLGPWRLNLPPQRYVDLYAGEEPRKLTLVDGPAGTRIEGFDEPLSARARWRDAQTIEADFEGDLVRATVVRHADALEVRVGGRTFRIGTRPPKAATGTAGGDGRIIAPMPGRVLGLFVKPGQTVAQGDRLAVLEAMKMEHRLTAPVAGTVKAVAVGEGDQVSEGALIVEIEAAQA